MADLRQPDSHSRRAGNGREAGFLLVGVVVMCALVLLALAVAAPVIAKDLRRDKEVESMHRAQQYVRAIQLYQRACKCKSYPANMDALEKSTTVRFLRKRYVDPLTGKSDWRLIHNPKTTIKGFFGQDLAGLSAGLGSAAGMASGTGSTPGAPATSTTSTIGQTSALASGFSGASITTGTSGASGSTGSTGNTGMFGDSSDGGVIYGVGTSKSGESILNPNQQTTYESWEFWYDPRIELLKASVNILGGGGPAGSTTGSGTVGSTDSSAFGQSISGQSNATGATGSTGSAFGSGTSGFGGTSPTTPSSGSNRFP